MASKYIVTRFVLLIISLFLLVACNPALLGTTKTATNSESLQAKTPTAFPSSITPTITLPPLASLPQNCPTQAIPQQNFSAIGPVVGQSPVQVTGFGGHSAEIRITPSSDVYTQYGWIWKLVWEVGPHFAQNVTIQGMNIRTGTPLQFQFDGQVTTSPVLNPQQPDHPQSAISSAYKEWGSTIYIPVAGCYSLEATWAGGYWQVNFAAGQ